MKRITTNPNCRYCDTALNAQTEEVHGTATAAWHQECADAIAGTEVDDRDRLGYVTF